MSMLRHVSLFAPPYQILTPCDGTMSFARARGYALVWHLHDAAHQHEEYEWLLQRGARAPLFVVLPPATAIAPILPIIPMLSRLHARGVLPDGPLDSVEPIRALLRSAPRDLPAAIVAYLTRRGMLRDGKARNLATKIFELAPVVPSISGLSRRLYTSRRSLGRYFESQQLPVPSHWLQFARLLYVAARLQANPQVPVFRVAIQLGYPDGFTMSNQMRRLVGCRPTDARENLGFEWFVEEWMERERATVEGR
jgi:AraC-like DNA-binding protein